MNNYEPTERLCTRPMRCARAAIAASRRDLWCHPPGSSPKKWPCPSERGQCVPPHRSRRCWNIDPGEVRVETRNLSRTAPGMAKLRAGQGFAPGCAIWRWRRRHLRLWSHGGPPPFSRHWTTGRRRLRRRIAPQRAAREATAALPQCDVAAQSSGVRQPLRCTPDLRARQMP